MKLFSGKLQFWERMKPHLGVPEHFVPLPYWYFTFLHAGNVFRPLERELLPALRKETDS
jgi:hypothetical protein